MFKSGHSTIYSINQYNNFITITFIVYIIGNYSIIIDKGYISNF